MQVWSIAIVNNWHKDISVSAVQCCRLCVVLLRRLFLALLSYVNPEEYVPRADLVLFVLSADRPLSESELAFLKYIRQWRKKVVFVVNKVGARG